MANTVIRRQKKFLYQYSRNQMPKRNKGPYLYYVSTQGWQFSLLYIVIMFLWYNNTLLIFAVRRVKHSYLHRALLVLYCFSSCIKQFRFLIPKPGFGGTIIHSNMPDNGQQLIFDGRRVEHSYLHRTFLVRTLLLVLCYQSALKKLYYCY